MSARRRYVDQLRMAHADFVATLTPASQDA